MELGKGVVCVKNGGKFFGDINVVDATSENNLGWSHTDMVRISGIRGTITEAACNVSLVDAEACPWDAVDLTVAV